jgi:hypothetical protein
LQLAVAERARCGAEPVAAGKSERRGDDEIGLAITVRRREREDSQSMTKGSREAAGGKICVKLMREFSTDDYSKSTGSRE